VGIHPETHTPIVANFGRFGPFILHNGLYANLESSDEVFTIGINRAVDMLAAKRAKGPSMRRGAQPLKDLGPHPDGSGLVQVFNGKYGAYVKHGKTNATLTGDKTPETITLDEAIALIAAKGGNSAPKKAARKAPVSKTTAKKAAKKPASKKPVAKKPVKKAAA
jgi:DNA topoisomerase I